MHSPKFSWQRRRKEREALAEDSEFKRAALRTQIANQSTSVLVLLSTGRLAAVFAWMQSLPLEAPRYSCAAVLAQSCGSSE